MITWKKTINPDEDSWSSDLEHIEVFTKAALAFGFYHKGNPIDEEASALLLTAHVKMKAIQ